MKRGCTSLAVLLLFGTAGCGFYFGGDDDDCNWGGGPVPGAPLDMRNPDTGLCESFGTWTECDDPCQPCPGAAESDAIAMPSWAYCDTYCEALDELTCMATSGCRAAYTDNCEGPGCADTGQTFYQCWGTDQSGPIQGGGCDGLDAWECSRHDDCIAVHYNSGCYAASDEAGVPLECEPLGAFKACMDEPIVCDEFNPDICPEGTECNAAEVCLPYPGCGGTDSNGFIDCEAACAGFCVPADPNTPGNCYEEVFCDAIEPNCPTDTLPGVKNGCYTGYCIPLAECPDAPPPPPPPTPCAEVTEEAVCIERADCTAYYEGVDCTCYPDGTCDCADWLFVDCQ